MADLSITLQGVEGRIGLGTSHRRRCSRAVRRQKVASPLALPRSGRSQPYSLSASHGGFTAAVYHHQPSPWFRSQPIPASRKIHHSLPTELSWHSRGTELMSRSSTSISKPSAPAHHFSSPRNQPTTPLQHGLPMGAPSHSCEARTADTTTSSSFPLLVARNKN